MKAGLIKHFEVVYLNVLKGRLFQEFQRVKFLKNYEQRHFREFIDYTSDYLFNKVVKNNLLRSNFSGVLNDFSFYSHCEFFINNQDFLG